MPALKKVLFLDFVFTFPYFGYSQSLNGFSMDEVKREFCDSKYYIEETKDGKINSDKYLIMVDIPIARLYFTFDDKKICEQTIIAPYDEMNLNCYIVHSDEKVIVISMTQSRECSGVLWDNIETVKIDDTWVKILSIE